ncbi:uncharacterized protein LOC121505265 [Cheilinus undulatus]|uniref:uncharacterized protein LOC121505265 n=1 Tax=Cheilinus undulatus TaxID=241271 RepID=UPI001BD3DF1E|nr:uncharacterized protein LOC121505265 [Cheilinus undulatus]
MTAETEEKKKGVFREPDQCFGIATSVVILGLVWCLLLVILTATGHFLDSQNFECLDNEENFVASRLTSEARLVYIWSGLSLPFCILLLVEIWRKKGFYFTATMATVTVLFVVMISTLMVLKKEEAQEIKNLEGRYLRLIPLGNQSNPQTWLADTSCHALDNVYHWQAKFKCCGLQGYQDWKPSIPESCLCDTEANSTTCVAVGDSLVYEKPCLPIVLSIAKKRSSTFWIIMIFWICCTALPIAFLGMMVMGLFCYIFYETCISECCYDINDCIYKMRGGEEMVPVVFIRKNNNNDIEEEQGDKEEAETRGTEENVVLEIEYDDNPVRMIPVSQLRKLQEELDPPPVQHQVQCLCIIASKPKPFYTILIDEDSPLLPEGAVLVDANKPTRICLWAVRHHVFDVEKFVWPKEETPVIS